MLAGLNQSPALRRRANQLPTDFIPVFFQFGGGPTPTQALLVPIFGGRES